MDKKALEETLGGIRAPTQDEKTFLEQSAENDGLTTSLTFQDLENPQKTLAELKRKA
jgi:hypothetical protein